MANFCVINCEETVWYIFYLFKGFIVESANIEAIFAF